MDPADHPDVTGRDTFGRGRLSAAATQAARGQARLHASQHAVASEVIAFQVVQQRAHLASAAEIDPARVAASLSAREREVVGLVAVGRTDGEIAAELRSTLTRGFTDAECEQFGFGSACPTLDEMRNGPAVDP